MQYTNKNILKITLPVLVSMLMEQLLSITDTAFLGRVSQVELGASAIAGVMYMTVFTASFGFAMGAEIMIGRRNGEKNYSAVGNIFYQGLYFQLIITAFAVLFTSLCMADIFKRILVSQDICKAATSYLDWRMYGFVFAAISMMYRTFLMGTVQTRSLIGNSLVLFVANCLFNYILIFGKLGFPQLGITGAAIGSSLAEVVGLIYFIISTKRQINIAKYALNKLHSPDVKLLWQILKISFWTMSQSVFAIATWFLFYLFIEHLGQTPIAVTNVLRSANSLIFIIYCSFASVTSTIVSNLMGENKQEEIIPLIRKSVKLSYICVLPFAAVYLLFPSFIMGIFTDIDEVILQGKDVVWVLCVITVIAAAANVWYDAVAGTGNTRAVFFMEITSLVVYTLFIYIVIWVKHSPLTVCWFADAVYYFVILVLSLLYFRFSAWRKRKI